MENITNNEALDGLEFEEKMLEHLAFIEKHTSPIGKIIEFNLSNNSGIMLFKKYNGEILKFIIYSYTPDHYSYENKGTVVGKINSNMADGVIAFAYDVKGCYIINLNLISNNYIDIYDEKRNFKILNVSYFKIDPIRKRYATYFDPENNTKHEKPFLDFIDKITPRYKYRRFGYFNHERLIPEGYKTSFLDLYEDLIKCDFKPVIESTNATNQITIKLIVDNKEKQLCIIPPNRFSSSVIKRIRSTTNDYICTLSLEPYFIRKFNKPIHYINRNQFVSDDAKNLLVISVNEEARKIKKSAENLKDEYSTGGIKKYKHRHKETAKNEAEVIITKSTEEKLSSPDHVEETINVSKSPAPTVDEKIKVDWNIMVQMLIDEAKNKGIKEVQINFVV